jgi:hypothetical protein
MDLYIVVVEDFIINETQSIHDDTLELSYSAFGDSDAVLNRVISPGDDFDGSTRNSCGAGDLPIPVQGRWLGQVVRGYYAYYSVPTNIHSMQAFRTQVERHWRHALTRRSQRVRPNWERMRRLSARWIPLPRILHPWPTGRFDVRHPR